MSGLSGSPPSPASPANVMQEFGGSLNAITQGKRFQDKQRAEVYFILQGMYGRGVAQAGYHAVLRRHQVE